MLEFFRPGASGQEEQHYKLELWNVLVSAIDFAMPNNRQPDLESRESYEIVAFIYQKIRWTWMDG